MHRMAAAKMAHEALTWHCLLGCSRQCCCMDLLPFGQLPPHAPRRFVPAQIDLGEWLQIAPLFDELEKRAGDCSSLADLEQWLRDWSELSAALDEELSRRHIAMTCHTDN